MRSSTDRRSKGLSVEANFVGVREIALTTATFDRDTGRARSPSASSAS